MAAGRISVCLGKTSRSPRRGAWQDKCWHPEVVSGDAATGDGAARGWGSLHSPLLVAPELCEHEDGGVPKWGAHPSPGCCQPLHPPRFVSGSRPGRPFGCRGLSWLRAVIWHAQAKQHQMRPEESSSQQQWGGGWGSRGRVGCAGGVLSSRVTRRRLVQLRSLQRDVPPDREPGCLSGKFTVAVALCRSWRYCGAVHKSVGLLGAREEQVVKRDSPSRAAGSSADPADCYRERSPAALPSR